MSAVETHRRTRAQFAWTGVVAAVAALAVAALLVSAEELNVGTIIASVATIAGAAIFATLSFWSRRYGKALALAERSVDLERVIAEAIVWARARPEGPSRPRAGYVTDRELILVSAGADESVERFNLADLAAAAYSSGWRNARLQLRFDSEEFELRSVQADLAQIYEALRPHVPKRV